MQKTGYREMTKITKRKKEIMELVAEGYKDKEIAEKLIVSPATVKSHLTALFQMLGISTRSELVTWGFRNGILK